MIITQILENITTFVQENICTQIELLKPSEKPLDSEYTEEYMNPTAFACFVPTKDKLPPDVECVIPSICVQLLEGSDDLKNNEETLQIRLAFSIWRPGSYGTVTTTTTDSDGNETTTEETKWTMNTDGWKDVLLALDRAKRIIQKTPYMEDMKVSKKDPIKFGFFFNEDGIVQQYPYWYAWISFNLTCGISAIAVADYQELL